MRCLDSIRHQSLPMSFFEVIVVDDGSSDETSVEMEDVQRSWTGAVRCTRRLHGGPAAARNSGIAMAAGDIVAFIDDDCVAARTWLERLIPSFSEDQAGGVEGKVLPRGGLSPLRHWVDNSRGGHYLTANVAYRRELLEEVGGFDESYLVAGGEDYDLAYRILERGYRIPFAEKAIVYHPVYVESFRQYARRRNAWWGSVRLSRKHPKVFRQHIGRGCLGNILFYTTIYPGHQLFSWRGWLLRHPRDLVFLMPRLAYHIYYGAYVLLRTLVAWIPKEVSRNTLQ